MNAATIDATLRELGSAPVSTPDIAALESRVLASIARSEMTVATRRRRRLGPVLVGAVAACLLALVVLAAGWFATGDDPYVLAAADGVEVVLPDGDVVAGTVGLELPVGSTLTVGGSMEIDGASYGPGEYLISDDGPVAVTAGDGGDGPEPAGIDDSGDRGDAPPIEATTTTMPPSPDPPVTADIRPTTATTVAPPTATTVPDRESRPTTTLGPADIAPRPPVVDPPPRPVDTKPASTLPPDRPARTTTTAPRDAPTTTEPRDQPTTTAHRDRGTTAPPDAPASDRGRGRP